MTQSDEHEPELSVQDLQDAASLFGRTLGMPTETMTATMNLFNELSAESDRGWPRSRRASISPVLWA